jgi:hypothetical protein
MVLWDKQEAKATIPSQAKMTSAKVCQRVAAGQGSGIYAMSSLIPVVRVEGNAPDVSRLVQFDTAT